MGASRGSSVLAVVVVAIGFGCGGKGGGKGASVSGVPAIDPDLCDTAGKRVETFDLNRDKKPDVWKLYAKSNEGGTEVEVLTCKQIDYDRDGQKDYVATYARTGELLAESIDLTFDGHFDAREHYDKKSGKLVAIERDSDHDKKSDVWEEYDSLGDLQAVRMDRNGDSKPDMWEQYVKGELEAILYDNDFDGRVDRKESRRGATPKPKLPPSVAPAEEPTAPAEEPAAKPPEKPPAKPKKSK